MVHSENVAAERCQHFTPVKSRVPEGLVTTNALCECKGGRRDHSVWPASRIGVSIPTQSVTHPGIVFACQVTTPALATRMRRALSPELS